MLPVMPGTLVAVAGALVARARTVVVMPVPGAVVAMMAVAVIPGAVVAVVVIAGAVAAVVVIPGAVVAMAAVVVRNEDERVWRKLVPIPVTAGMATRMLPMTVMSALHRFVQHPVQGSRGNSEENRLAGREVIAVPATVALSLPGERRLDAERKHCEQRRERRREQGRQCGS